MLGLIHAFRYENSIIAFSADNGGAPGVGSNYPLRGCKSTFFEGVATSTSFWTIFFSRGSPACTTPHAPCNTPY